MMGRVDEVPQEIPRRALVIGTGGTIAMLGRSQYDWVEYGEGGSVRPITEVLRELQPLLTDVEVEIVSSRTLASTGVDWKDWVELACLIRAVTAKRRDVRGVVLTHGTASLEDTAWFLELVCETPLPIVLVGAQRPPNTVGSDAAPNLRAGLAVAMAGPCRGLGVLVVMNNQVFAARDVRKASNFSLEAFEAPEFGPLGRVEADGTVVIRRHPTRRPPQAAELLAHALEVPQAARVDVALSYPGADGTAIRAFQQAGARAIVSVGMPPGRCTPAERAALREAVRAGLLVVQSSRAARGSVVPQQYNAADGIESGSDLAANKMRVLLMLALTAGMTHAQIRELLAQI
jgi:L-asparaginase